VRLLKRDAHVRYDTMRLAVGLANTDSAVRGALLFPQQRVP